VAHEAFVRTRKTMMTPQERQLVTDLFERLATLEKSERDPEAERIIAEGLKRAPNAPYALVQTVLVQDQALRDADFRIRDLEGSGGDRARKTRFLDDMRGALFGHTDEPRGSVPAVNAPGGSAVGRDGNLQASPQDQTRSGSFLGTAAAAAAGVIGGALMLDGIRSILGARHGAMGDAAAAGSLDRPWGGGAADSDLARQAGIEDVGSGAAHAADDSGGQSFDTAEADLDDDAFGGDFDLGGGSDIA
jgi:uncharacterized protein